MYAHRRVLVRYKTTNSFSCFLAIETSWSQRRTCKEFLSWTTSSSRSREVFPRHESTEFFKRLSFYFNYTNKWNFHVSPKLLAKICRFSISSLFAVVNRSANFQIITHPALSPQAKIFGLKIEKTLISKEKKNKIVFHFLRFMIEFESSDCCSFIWWR